MERGRVGPGQEMEDRFSGQEGSLQSGSVGGKRTRDRGLVGRDGLRGKYCVSGPLTDKRVAANWWVDDVVGRATNATSTVGVECRTVSCNIALIGVGTMFLVVSYRKVSVKFWACALW